MNKGKKLVAGGPWQRVSLRAVFREAEVILPLAEQHAANLAACGWTEAHTRKLRDEMEKLRSVQAERLTLRANNRQATADGKVQIRRLMKFRARLFAAITLAARSGIAGADPALFTKARMGYRSGDILSWLVEIRGVLRRIDERLQRGFYPRSAAAELDELAREYRQIVRTGSAGRREERSRNAAVKAVRQSIGALLSQLRLAIRVAFADDRATLREFRLALKSGRKRPAASLAKAA